MRLWYFALLLTLFGLASAKVEPQQESQQTFSRDPIDSAVIESPPTSGETIIESNESAEEEINPEVYQNNGEAKATPSKVNYTQDSSNESENVVRLSEDADEEPEMEEKDEDERNNDKNNSIEHEIEHEPEIEDQSNEESEQDERSESDDNELNQSSVEEELEEDPELPDESSEERDDEAVPVENNDSSMEKNDEKEPHHEEHEEIEDEHEMEDKSNEEGVDDKNGVEEEANNGNENGDGAQQDQITDVVGTQSETDVDEKSDDENEGANEKVEPEMLEASHGNITDDMSENDIYSAIIAEAEKAFKVAIEQMEKEEEADNVCGESKVNEEEEKNIDILLADDADQKDDLTADNAEKEAENSIVKEIQSQIRLRRASDDPTEQPEGAKPIELPTETKDATGKSEALPATIEKDVPKTETEQQDLAEKKFTDKLGWTHYPWKKFPLLKNRLHYEKQCGCKVIWIKKVYTRPRPKSKLVLAHSSYINLNKHRHHHARGPCKKSQIGRNVHVHKERRSLGEHLAEKSWREHVVMKKSVVRSGKRAYSKRFGKVFGHRSIKKSA